MEHSIGYGAITGTPEVAGEFDVTLQVMYPDGSLIEETLKVTVKASAPEIVGSAPTEVQDTTKFNGTVTKTGGDFPSVFVYYGKQWCLTHRQDHALTLVSKVDHSLNVW